MPVSPGEGLRENRKHRYLSGSAIALAVTLLGAVVPSGMAASTIEVPVTARPISAFEVGSGQTTFGKLEFMGGLVMNSPEPLFGAISSIRFLPDGRNFLAVLDTGHWLRGAIERSDGDVLMGLSKVRIDPMLDGNGMEAKRKADMDAEGLVLRSDQIIVSYEQQPRIEIYSNGNAEIGRPIGRLPHLVPDYEFRRNAGMETLAISPAQSHLKGAIVMVTEGSLNSDGKFFAAILDGPLRGIFAVAPDHEYSVTDGTFLPDGDLLLLERRFNLALGVGMRIRRIKGNTIRPGAVVDGEILIEASLSNQIDNMEGMDVVSGPDGSTRIVLVSDDNHSFLQRNLMLEFKLLD